MHTKANPPKKNTVLIEKRVRYFLPHQLGQIFWYGSTLANKYFTEKLICQGLKYAIKQLM